MAELIKIGPDPRLDMAKFANMAKVREEAIQAALDYAKADGDTLVIVTADHETGGITLINDEYVYTSGSHTGVNVPLLVYGCDNFIKNGLRSGIWKYPAASPA